LNWDKKGLIFKPDKTNYWQNSHAALPTRLHVEEDRYRIYFTSRNSENYTYVGWFEIDIKEPKTILKTSNVPVLSPGALGHFDDHGVQCCSVIPVNGKHYLYYLGWNPGLKKPLFYTSIGLAISEDGGLTFKKHSPAPIMERSRYDPWMVSGGTVLLEKGLWRMWYLSGFKFELLEKGAKSWYDIKYAESEDGIHWKRNGHICLPLSKNETNISRPSIIIENGRYKAWYPTKKDGMGYRVGYAESRDGLLWHRMDETVGIDVSYDGWDSDAIDKIEVIAHKGKKYMFYNGNNFGQDGIGLAVLKE
jgi:hypothetical protein